MMIVLGYLELSGFFEYLRVGLPITLLTLAAACFPEPSELAWPDDRNGPF